MNETRPTRASFDRRISVSGEKQMSKDGAALMQRQTTILRVTDKEKKPDIFDSEDFDATSFINKLYPDGAFEGICLTPVHMARCAERQLASLALAVSRVRRQACMAKEVVHVQIGKHAALGYSSMRRVCLPCHGLMMQHGTQRNAWFVCIPPMQ